MRISISHFNDNLLCLLRWFFQFSRPASKSSRFLSAPIPPQPIVFSFRPQDTTITITARLFRVHRTQKKKKKHPPSDQRTAGQPAAGMIPNSLALLLMKDSGELNRLDVWACGSWIPRLVLNSLSTPSRGGNHEENLGLAAAFLMNPSILLILRSLRVLIPRVSMCSSTGTS